MFAFGFWRMLYEGKEVSCYSYFANLFFKLWLIVECFQAFFFFCSCIEMIGLLFYLLKFFFLITLSIYIWLCQDSVATLALTGCSEWGLRSASCRLLVPVASLLQHTGSRACGAQQLRHMGSAAASPGLWSTGAALGCVGFVAPLHMAFSWVRDQTRISCTCRWNFYHWATREGPLFSLNAFIF